MSRLAANLEKYTRDELAAYADSLGLTGTEGLSLKDLAGRIAGWLLDPEVFRKRMGILTDEQIRIFEKAMACPYVPARSEYMDLMRLHDLDYLFWSREDGRISIPEDAAAAYRNCADRAFHYYRRRISWLMRCLYFCETCYGVLPMDLFVRMGRRHPLYIMSEDRVRTLFAEIPQDLKDCTLTAGFLLFDRFGDRETCGDLLRSQEGSLYYEPSYEEIEEHWNGLYTLRSSAWQAFRDFLKETQPMDETAVSELVYEIWARLTEDEDYRSLVLELAGNRLVFTRDRDIPLFLRRLREAAADTRLLSLRGHTRLETEAFEENSSPACVRLIMPGTRRAYLVLRQAAGRDPDLKWSPASELSIMKIGIGNREWKVFPGDPCPCGSGKTAAACHGAPGTGK